MSHSIHPLKSPLPNAGTILLAALAFLPTLVVSLAGQGLPEAALDAEGCLARAEEAVAGLLAAEGLPTRRPEVIGKPVAMPPPRTPNNDAQGRAAGVEGLVTDGMGAVLPGVTVELVAPKPPPWPVVKSNPAGWFHMGEIEPGEATLRFHLAGYKQALYTLRLEPGVVRRISPALEVGDPSEEITLTDADQSPQFPTAIVPIGAALSPGQFRPFSVFCFEDSAVALQPQIGRTAERLPLSRQEFERVSEELREFRRDLLDVQRGPERMGSHLSEDLLRAWHLVQAAADSEAGVARPSPEEMRDWISVWLVNLALETWVRLERLSVPDRRAFQGTFQQRRQLDEEAAAQMVGDLRRVGALDRERIEAVTPYLRGLLGEGSLAKLRMPIHFDVNGPASPEVVYQTSLVSMHLFFAWRQGRLRLVFLVFG